MEKEKASQVLRKVEELNENNEISIIKISEPISSAVAQELRQHQQQQQQRTSDASNASQDATSPSSLDADLAHYKELFAKLRFSYVEQVTKEKFIRAIVGDPPLIVTPQENLELEKANLAAKAQLKALKVEVADMVKELEEKGKELSKRYESVQLDTAKLKELPDKILELEERVAELREAQAPGQSSSPQMNLPLAKTLELVDEKKRQQRQLDRELEQLQARAPRKRKELERLQAELQPLEIKRQNSTAAAKEARRRKEGAGGDADDLEERGRWLRASEAALKQMLDVQA